MNPLQLIRVMPAERGKVFIGAQVSLYPMTSDFAYMTSLGFMSARAAGADITALWATMSCCRFRGHEDKIVTSEPESGYDETKVQL